MYLHLRNDSYTETIYGHRDPTYLSGRRNHRSESERIGTVEQRANRANKRLVFYEKLARVTSFMLAGYVVVAFRPYIDRRLLRRRYYSQKGHRGLPDGSENFHIRLRRQSEGGLTKWGP